MQRKIIRFSAKCVNQNDAATFCADAGCKHPSLMCDVNGCKCKLAHSPCILTSTLDKLAQRFEIKEEIYRWYQSQCKLINVEMEELKGMMDNQQILLQGNEEKLYSYLVEGRSELVLPSLVAEVIASLAKEPQHNISTKIEQTKKELLKQENILKQTFQKVKNLYKPQTQLTKPQLSPTKSSLPITKFDRNLCSSQITVVSDHMIRVDGPTNRYNTALLTPSIQNSLFNIISFRFQIIKMINNSLMFGVCQVPNDFSIQSGVDLYDKQENGAFVISDGRFFLGKAKGNRQDSRGIKISQIGDTIEVIYERNAKKVTIKNVTKNTLNSAFITVDQNKPLYVGLLMYSNNDQVQLISVDRKE